MIGGFPQADGDSYASFFPIENGVMPFPGWEPFEGADSADIDDKTRKAFADAAKQGFTGFLFEGDSFSGHYLAPDFVFS